MDSAAAFNEDVNQSKLCNYFTRANNFELLTNVKQKNAIVKYTKLPDFDFDTRVSWPAHSYTLPPRLRRIIELQDPNVMTTRSLKLEAPAIVSCCTKRKIVTITEDDEFDHKAKLSQRPASLKSSANRCVGTNSKELLYQPSHRSSSRFSNTSKYSKEIKQSAKTNILNNNNNKEENILKSTHYRSKTYNISNLNIGENTKNRVAREKETMRGSATSSVKSNKINVRKSSITPSESEKEVNLLKNQLIDKLKSVSPKKPSERSKVKKSNNIQGRQKLSFWDEIRSKNKPVTIIHAPLDKKCLQSDPNVEITLVNTDPETFIEDKTLKVACGTQVDRILITKDANLETDRLTNKENKYTEIDYKAICTYDEIDDVEKEVIHDKFDCLDIPNVTLTKDGSKDEINIYSKSLPNLKIPSRDIIYSPDNEEKSSKFRNSASVIIGRATLTYTTRQKFNFHVLSSNDDTTTASQSPSPLAYPINVVSVYKKQLKTGATTKVSRDSKYNNSNQKIRLDTSYKSSQLFNCPQEVNSDKLVKPSDVISSIRVNSSLLKNDHVCDQFERELNFIDSFFDSLQYLENCSLTKKCFSENKLQNWISNTEFHENNFEYGSIISKLEKSDANIEDTETIDSKRLCLLNLLIRDEQRRAKNLLFVLKMREESLKDFTKSHILWLENKKKQDHTDTTTLKKKQRGALLKLQWECGEMQRIRKTLLTLSQKRKAALMRTKKNIELKLKNTVDVDQILLNKRKPKKSTSSDRNLAPLKCFDLSSSGCDDSPTNVLNTHRSVLKSPVKSDSQTGIASVEKCVQTGDIVLETFDQSSNTAAENCVIVDGGYLNILFHNLSLPQIFSSGKQYEVNEEALKNIVNSANTYYTLPETNVVENFMDQIKSHEQEKSSTPSTARSLVEEFDKYYKGLVDEDKSPDDTTDFDFNLPAVHEVKDKLQQVSDTSFDIHEVERKNSAVHSISNDSSDTITDKPNILSSVECQTTKGRDFSETGSQTGPLPVPVGAAAVVEDQPQLSNRLPQSKSTSPESSSASSESLCLGASSLSSLVSPVHSEAEELRRQQLAIEREIKALEQQQNQLLVIREIPDKPPPPYTPPSDAHAPRPPRLFKPDDGTQAKVQKHITEPDSVNVDPTDHFDVFLKDYSVETIERQKMDLSENPWDACNLLPQKREMDPEKLAKRTAKDLVELLSGVTPAVVTGVSNRRSDHIDDILFAEWRRCEPEWTALHVDEVLVKNQVFESIFQKVLSETIDQYKKTVISAEDGDSGCN